MYQIIEDNIYFVEIPKYFTFQEISGLRHEYVRSIIMFSICFNNIKLLGELTLYIIQNTRRPSTFLNGLRRDIYLIFNHL